MAAYAMPMQVVSTSLAAPTYGAPVQAYGSYTASAPVTYAAPSVSYGSSAAPAPVTSAAAPVPSMPGVQAATAPPVSYGSYTAPPTYGSRTLPSAPVTVTAPAAPKVVSAASVASFVVNAEAPVPSSATKVQPVAAPTMMSRGARVRNPVFRSSNAPETVEEGEDNEEKAEDKTQPVETVEEAEDKTQKVEIVEQAQYSEPIEEHDENFMGQLEMKLGRPAIGEDVLLTRGGSKLTVESLSDLPEHELQAVFPIKVFLGIVQVQAKEGDEEQTKEGDEEQTKEGDEEQTKEGEEEVKAATSTSSSKKKKPSTKRKTKSGCC
eukprot:TRINITY_DN8555_c0_g1_i1.p1 TRINITY_DN8555_c0_g1~~TRINITY_DN8555_c0_g1_i1.p1  ORF type:complete len:349 (+),score=97.82 TRINITY_DN8555_c0_g1_i1:86-1048(+)